MRRRPSELFNDPQGEELPKSSNMNRFQYLVKKGASLFYHFFTCFATGSVETEIEDNDSSASYIYIERIIVLALTAFLLFTVLLYGESTAAEFVNYPQGPE